jgi:hypothetical protein
VPRLLTNDRISFSTVLRDVVAFAGSPTSRTAITTPALRTTSRCPMSHSNVSSSSPRSNVQTTTAEPSVPPAISSGNP